MSIVIIAGVLLTLVTGAPVLMQMLRGHPRGLLVLFFAEMWERFSYYGMRGLLVFYLTQQFLFSDAFAASTYGSYATLVYLVPLVGGVIADRWLGARKAVAFGALLLVAGHSTMAIESPPAHQVLTWRGAHYAFEAKGQGANREARIMVAGKPYDFGQDAAGDFTIKGLPASAPLPGLLAKGDYALSVEGRQPKAVDTLYLALALIVMGVGFLKSNISAIVGKLYGERDPRRDPGFTLYYYGINLGAFWAAVLCGYLGESYGWSWGFGAAGVGMLAGYITFQAGRSWLGGHGEPPDPAKLARPRVGPLNLEWLIYLGGVAAVGLVWLLVQHNQVVGWALGVGWIAALAYITYVMATRFGRVERERVMLSFVFMIGAIVFFALFEQAATSLNLFAERNTQLGLISAPKSLTVFGQPVFLGTRAMWQAAPHAPGALWIDMGFDAAQTQSFNAGFILLFAPVFAALWAALGRRRRDPDPMIKFGLGLGQVGLGFLVIVWSQGLADAQFRLPLLVLAFAYLLHTTGELCLSPVGLSEITKLAPAELISTLLSLWFLATSAGEFISAMIARFAGSAAAGGKVLDPHASLVTSLAVFQIIGWVGIGFGAAFLLAAPFTHRLAHGVNDLAAEPVAAE
ncbi:MAG TPA: oligopeptide:H+ symporter [Caulobacteraceae bacterium]|jgi:POT family proton-dependent oligopeptide transporter|nr:oligopeptide:H+ symporter [Caulobacteraceae bacterium]